MMVSPHTKGKSAQQSEKAKPFAFLSLVFIIIIMNPLYTFAYLDAGSGSYIIQIVIAAFLGALYTFKSMLGQVFRKIMSIFRKKGNEK